jgi:alkylhydroperoxidase family enzyme
VDEQQVESTGAPVRVKLGKFEYELKAPPSYSIRHEIALAAVSNRHRAFAAALGVCAFRPELGRAATIEGRLKVAPYSADFNPLAYGGRIFDALIAAGVRREDIIAAGAAAYVLIQDGLFGDEEVKAAEVFTDPPPDGGTA